MNAPTPDTQDFLSDVADEMEAAAAQLETGGGCSSSAAAQGAFAGMAAARNAAFGSKLLYTASYTLSYGLCFPVFVVAKYIPKNNQFVEGLVDGGVSAQRAADSMLNRPAVAVSHQGAEALA